MSTTKKQGVRRKLSEYHGKRDFTKTAEPEGDSAQPPQRRTLCFVIQKHAASHLHFDFRLELDGVMKSWAVPKGPSYDPAVKRLAMEVEDHPVEYNTFEGTIPKGEYGGGTVMLWDRGTYAAEDGGGEESLRRGYARGDLKLTIRGKRLRGGWVLVRTKRGDPDRAQWLLIKHRDESARSGSDVVADATTSVISGRTMDEIARNSRRVWKSNRSASPGVSGATPRGKPSRRGRPSKAGERGLPPRTKGSGPVPRARTVAKKGSKRS